MFRLVGKGKTSGAPVDHEIGLAYTFRNGKLWRMRSYLNPDVHPDQGMADRPRHAAPGQFLHIGPGPGPAEAQIRRWPSLSASGAGPAR